MDQYLGNKCIYYTSREFPIQNFHRRTTDIYNFTRCYSDSEYCHVFAVAAGDIIKYQGGHMMPMHVWLVHIRRRSTAMAEMTHDLVTLNSK